MTVQNHSHPVKVKCRIELAQRVIGGNVIFKSELIKQLLWRILPSHHRPFPHCYPSKT